MKGRDYIYMVIIAALLATMFWRKATNESEPLTAEVKYVESAEFFSPEPITLDYRTARVAVPRWLFKAPEELPANPTAELMEAKATDSVDLNVTIESRTYRDSTFEATISGPAIGYLRPSLDNIRTFNHTKEITRTVAILPDKWWEVRATAGAMFAHDRADAWAGIAADRHAGRWSYGASIGYSLAGHPVAEMRAGYRLFGGQK